MSLPDAIVAALEAGHTLVTPSPQRAVAVREAWARRQIASGRRVWATPDVLHFDAWVERTLGTAPERGVQVPRLLSPVEQQLVWRAAAGAVIEGENAELLGASRLGESLRRADALVGSHAIPARRLRDDSSSEARWLCLARESLREALDRLDARLGWHSEHVAWASCLTAAQPVKLVGFDALLPAQRAFVSATIEHQGGSAELALPADQLATPLVVSASDSVEELRQIAVWCRLHLQRKPDAQLLVVLPDLDNRRALLERALLDELDPGALALAEMATDRIAFEGGQTLAALPRVAQALETLARLVEPLEREDWLRWLRGPAGASIADPGRKSLECALLRWQGEALMLPALLRLAGLEDPLPEALPPWLARANQALELLAGRSDSTAQWARLFDQALRVMDPEPSSLDSAAWQTHERWQQLLGDFAAAQTIAGALGPREALRQLRSLAQRTRFAPSAPAAAVLVTAATADPIVCYDGIWVGGLHEAAFPRAAHSEAFLPWGLQREFGVADADPDALLARARRELTAWRRCAGDLRLSFAREDNGAEQAGSPLLRPWSSANDVVCVPLPRRGAAQHQRAVVGTSAPLEAHDDRCGSLWSADSPLLGGTATLASYNQCAFRGYAQSRLTAHAADDPHTGIDPRSRGLLYHGALQQLWSKWKAVEVLRQLTDEQRRAAIASSLRAAAKHEAVRGLGPVAARSMDRELQRAQELIDALLLLEAQRADFRVRMLEESLSLQVGPARLKLRIDRVDAIADDALVIIDYKTGRGVPADWNSERPDTIQLLAYRAALHQQFARPEHAPSAAEIVGLCYAQLSESQVRYRGVAAQSEPLSPALPKQRPRRDAPTWAERTAGWDRHLEWLGKRIGAGDATVEPRPAVCRSCDLALLCRRAEHVAALENDVDASSDDDPGEDGA